MFSWPSSRAAECAVKAREIEVEMGTGDRKERERGKRERRITAVARSLAEQGGWEAVTIRRLADEIEYSQPVIYSHFESRDAIIASVAVEGFRELAAVLRCAATDTGDPGAALRRVATAYLAFSREHPAVYAAMFTMPTILHFAQDDTKPELRDAFATLASVVRRATTSDVEDVTETFWAMLHGLSELERSGRIRRGARDKRVSLAINRLFER